jgi:hypothetical protein
MRKKTAGTENRGLSKKHGKRKDKSETEAQKQTSKDYWNKIMSLKDEEEPKAIKPKK